MTLHGNSISDKLAAVLACGQELHWNGHAPLAFTGRHNLLPLITKFGKQLCGCPVRNLQKTLRTPGVILLNVLCEPSNGLQARSWQGKLLVVWSKQTKHTRLTGKVRTKQYPFFAH